jgi:DNA-binding LytR/AlgR family response regulator
MQIYLLEDDDDYAAEAAGRIAGAFPQDECRVLRSGREALSTAKNVPPDVLIADIQLEQENGIDIARIVAGMCPRCKVIFLTAHPGATHDIYGAIQPYAVYHKGFAPWEHLFRALKSIAAEWEMENRRLTLAVGSKVLDLPLQEIRFIEHRLNDSKFHCAAREVAARVRLDDVQPLLDKRFVRCHQSYIVNLDAAEGMAQEAFLLPGGVRIPISRAHKEAAKQAFHLRKGGAV